MLEESCAWDGGDLFGLLVSFFDTTVNFVSGDLDNSSTYLKPIYMKISAFSDAFLPLEPYGTLVVL